MYYLAIQDTKFIDKLEELILNYIIFVDCLSRRNENVFNIFSLRSKRAYCEEKYL